MPFPDTAFCREQRYQLASRSQNTLDFLQCAPQVCDVLKDEVGRDVVEAGIRERQSAVADFQKAGA
jgi:hypothetical protein